MYYNFIILIDFGTIPQETLKKIIIIIAVLFMKLIPEDNALGCLH